MAAEASAAERASLTFVHSAKLFLTVDSETLEVTKVAVLIADEEVDRTPFAIDGDVTPGAIEAAWRKLDAESWEPLDQEMPPGIVFES